MTAWAALSGTEYHRNPPAPTGSLWGNLGLTRDTPGPPAANTPPPDSHRPPCSPPPNVCSYLPLRRGLRAFFWGGGTLFFRFGVDETCARHYHWLPNMQWTTRKRGLLLLRLTEYAKPRRKHKTLDIYIKSTKDQLRWRGAPGKAKRGPSCAAVTFPLPTAFVT